MPLQAPINADNRRYMTAKAARVGHRFDHLTASLADKTLPAKLRRYTSPDLLVIDEFGFVGSGGGREVPRDAESDAGELRDAESDAGELRDAETRDAVSDAATDAGPDALYLRGVLLDELDVALGELPAEQREVFLAHEMEGRSFKELSAESGVSVNTLLSRKRYAVLHLQQRLRAAWDDWLLT